MAFHAKDGWFFRRNNDGSVSIAKLAMDITCLPGEDNALTGDEIDARIDREVALDLRNGHGVQIDANMWQSIIASVSAEGENNYRFDLAGKFHNGGMKRCAHILAGDFVGAGGPCGLYLDVHHMIDHDHAFVADR